MTSAEIRQKFMDFFGSHGHEIVPSAPIVIKNDPTLLFTNAGMNPFKDYFLGNRKAPHARIADTQKCLRVSGKHNDLEEVGVDTYHHTMFEMLGNWSFGDYFKKEAIEWSWDLLTNVYGIPKDRLYVTIFEGDQKENLPKDVDALNEWKKWISEDRIINGNKKDNFWEMGDTGPCGPCSEIHVDCRTDEERSKVDGKKLVNADHPQVIEIWNNVFMEFNRLKNGSLEPLPEKHVDTGMGLERLVRVLQHKTSNYDTDLFTGTISETEKMTGLRYEFGDTRKDIAFRVIADHIRAISFTIADGQLPSNTGAGYVIRRILRRAVRYYFSYLNYKQPLLYKLIPTLGEQFSNVFPELKKQSEFVAKVIHEEEEAFLRTLDKGLKKMDDIMVSSKDKIIQGAAAFELLDTYGFPIDLTRLIARENEFDVDDPGFEKEMLKQKERSRAASTVDAEDWVELSTDRTVTFLGYGQVETSTSILRYRKVKSKGSESWQVVLRETPFYAESGGQVGDSGIIESKGIKYTVTDTRKENDLIIHFMDELPKDPSAPVLASINANRRRSITIHHSATHLLHAALRKVLGTHVAQKGSLVNQEILRFDFSHFSKMTEEEIHSVEKIVNEKIRENVPVVIKELPKEEALSLGAMALFGEKYGDKVRVVIMDAAYSIELCGGTHVGYTGELGILKIVAESAVAAGVRRIEAVSGATAEKFIQTELGELNEVKRLLKNPKELNKAIEQLQSDNAEMKKQLEHLESKMLQSLMQDLISRKKIINGVSFIGEKVDVSSAESLKKLCVDFRSALQDHLVILVSNINGKASVAIGISDSLVSTKGFDAGKIIKETVAPLIKGGGGGQKNLATAGGQDISNLLEVIAAVQKSI
ncbi:MAG: alanine--tRNA ligase [Chitinophagaceae bacterium]